MKRTSVFTSARLATLILAAALTAQAASLTIGPSVITNDFVGKVTLAITGITNSRTVLVQQFADENFNNIVDPGEPLIRSFTIQDGSLPLIGGVRNLNVAGDEDGLTNSQARVELFFPGVDVTMGRLEGNYVFRISSPTGAFSTAAATMTTRQKPAAQGVRGRITDSATGLPLTNASAVLLDNRGMGLSGTMSVSNGYYTLLATPGNYMVWPFRDGYILNMNASGAAVTAGQFTTNNFALIAGTFTASGRLTDATNGTGLAGVGIMAQSTNNLFAFTFTDTNGNFAFKLPAGHWQIACNSTVLPPMGYVSLQTGIEGNLSASVTNLALQAVKATSLIYGSITDEQSKPVISVGLYCDSQDHVFETEGVSYPTNGAYCLGAAAGNWWAGVSSDTLPQLGYVGGNSTNITLNAGQAVRADFALTKVTAHLRGRVVDETGTPTTYLNIGAKGGDLWSGTTTDGSGNFDMGVSAGEWSFQISNDDAQSRGLIGIPLSVTVTNGQTRSNLTFVVYHVTAQISGRVKDSNGTGIPGISVRTSTTLNGTNYDTYLWTDNGGYYQCDVFNGPWTVSPNCYDLAQRGFGCPSDQLVVITGTNRVVDFIVGPSSLQVLTTWLPDGIVNTHYDALLEATGGTPGYSWDLAPGSNPLPSNLHLASDGTLAGDLDTVGSFFFTVRVTDAKNATAEQTLWLNVIEQPSPVTLNSVSIAPDGSFKFTVSGANGRSFDVQASPDLINWGTISTLSEPPGDVPVTVPPQPDYPNLFFRVRFN